MGSQLKLVQHNVAQVEALTNQHNSMLTQTEFVYPYTNDEGCGNTKSQKNANSCNFSQADLQTIVEKDIQKKYRNSLITCDVRFLTDKRLIRFKGNINILVIY